jgi:GNAT superfamily N-acetyltransferase
MGDELIIRPARPDDRQVMERICTQTWDWGDYVPQVWDDWLADEQGSVLVGEAEGQVVALSKITFQTPDQVWLEGMRVDPEFRRRGIAGQFLRYSLDHVHDEGARVVRLGTGSGNMPVHIITARAGMERIGSYVLRTAEPLPDGPEPTVLAPDQAVQVSVFLQKSPVLAHSHGLYSMDWAWQELSGERMVRFLRDGQVAAQLAPDGSLVALAILRFEPDDDELWIGLADGQSDAVSTLATDIRVYATRVGAPKVRVFLPDVDWLRAAFEAAGYGFGDWEGDLWIFERRLDRDDEGQP